jgi:hypothetical protein
MDWATIIFSFAAMFFAFKNWWNNKKQLKPIPIIIDKNGKKDILPFDIMRKNLTRSEVFGVLGAFDKESNFSIKYTASKDFFRQVSDVQEGKKDEIVIYLKDGDKFDWISE